MANLWSRGRSLLNFEDMTFTRTHYALMTYRLKAIDAQIFKTLGIDIYPPPLKSPLRALRALQPKPKKAV